MLQALPSLSRPEGSPWLARGDVLSLLLCSHQSLTSPIPPTPAVPPANHTSSHGSKPPHKGCCFPTATAAATPHPLAAAGPQGYEPGCSPKHRGEEGLRQAEDGGGRDREGWEGALFFFWPEHTCPFSVSPSTFTSLGCAAWHLGTAAICPRWPGSPLKGDFVTDTSGWGGGGQGVRHDGGGGKECAPLRRFPGMGWVVGHPSMSQLKRWCFTSMSCTPSFSGFFSFSSLFIGSSQS